MSPMDPLKDIEWQNHLICLFKNDNNKDSCNLAVTSFFYHNLSSHTSTIQVDSKILILPLNSCRKFKINHNLWDFLIGFYFIHTVLSIYLLLNLGGKYPIMVWPWWWMYNCINFHCYNLQALDLACVLSKFSPRIHMCLSKTK